MVPFVDLKVQYEQIKGEIHEAISSVLESCQFVLGPFVSAFEEAYAAYCGVRYAVGVNSGTSALHLALLAAGVGPGDEVITVPFTFVATVAAIRYTGARPVFVDIDPRTYTMDVRSLERSVTAATKAVIPVHLYGHPAEMDTIRDIARRNGLVVIEDAAQAHGAEYRGRKVGSLGDMGCFSFYPGKNLGAYGEGGAVVTNSPEYDRILRMLRDWGGERKYEHVLKGYNYRMEALQGAILSVKLRYLHQWTEARRERARLYTSLLRDTDLAVPVEMADSKHVYHIYAVRTHQRDALQKVLADHNIQTGIHYPYAVHLLPAHSDLGYKPGDFPHAEAAAREVLSLPMYPELPEEAVKQVCEVIQKVRPGKKAL
ncbi:DegT/DnrJ/EryC1/StrS family aminotransferase [Desulfosoma sp.]